MRKGRGLSSGRAVRRAAFTTLETLECRRLMSAGQLDTSFGSPNGYVTTSFDGTSDDSAFAQIIDQNGKLVVAGFSSNGATIERFNSDGSPDTSFDGDGIAYVDPAQMAAAHSIVEDSGGYVLGGSTANQAPSFIRLDSSGALDASFGSNGATIVNAPEQGDIDGVIIDGTGHVAGMLTYANDDSFSAVRLDATGNVDPNFGTNGIATHSFAGSGGDKAYAILDNGNGILLGGESFQTSTNTRQPAFAQFDSSGQPDPSFGPGGDKVFTTAGDFIESATIHTMAHDGSSILAAGQAHFGGGDPLFAMHISTGGTLDTSFANNSGEAIVPAADTFAQSVGRDNQGRIYLMGNSGGNYAVARLDSTGNVDLPYGGSNQGYNVFLNIGFPSMGYVDASLSSPVDGTVHMVGTTVSNAGDADWQRVTIDPSGTSVSHTETSFQGPQFASGQAVALQGTNIVVAGSMSPFQASNNVLALAIYDSQGHLMSQATHDLGINVDPHGVVVDGSGNIYVGFTAMGGDNDFGVAEFDSSGTFVNSWIDTAAGQDNVVVAMALSSDGTHVYLGGTTDGDFEFDSFDLANQQFDPHVVDLGGSESLGGIAVESDGNIVLAGSSDSQIGLVRLQPDGTQVGPSATTSESDLIAGTSVALAGGNIYVGGLDASTGESTLFKFDSSTLQLLSSSGVVIDGATYLTSVGVAPNGTIVAAGTSTANSSFAVVRFDSAGNLDESFGSGGVSLVSVGGTGAVGGLAIQSDNNIVVAGTGVQSAFSSFAVARLDGSVAGGNVAPSPTINGAPGSSPEGTQIDLTSTVVDPDSSSFTYDWEVTKNSQSYSSGSAANFSFTPDDNGSYVVTLTVSDGTDSGTDTKTITVTNVNPNTPTINGAPASMAEGTSQSFSSSVTDPGSADTFTYSWTLTKDGNPIGPSGTSSTYNFAPGDNGTYVVTLQVTDDDGGSSSTTATINVTNVAPTASIGGPSTVQAGQSVSYTLGASDVAADVAAGFSYQIDWDGNGSIDQTVPVTIGPVNVAHTFNTAGNFTIKVTATDKDGGASSQATFAVSVVAQPPPPTVTATMSGNDLVVTGTTGNDGIILLPGPGGSTSVYAGATNLGSFSPSGRIVINGGNGSDIIALIGVNHAIEVNAGDGNDIVYAGNGGDIIVGGAGNDLLIGGSGRDLMIGGTGADSVFGSNDDDILIAGTTSFDNDPTSLEKILAEWNSGRNYQTRIANIRGTGSGSTFTARLNDNVFLKTGTGATVFDDGARDNLTGGAGRDWFIFNSDSGVKDNAIDDAGNETDTDV